MSFSVYREVGSLISDMSFVYGKFNYIFIKFLLLYFIKII